MAGFFSAQTAPFGGHYLPHWVTCTAARRDDAGTRVSSPTAETAASKPAQSRFESGETHGSLAQLAEAPDLGSGQCEFESHGSYGSRRGKVPGLAVNQSTVGSIPAAPTLMQTAKPL